MIDAPRLATAAQSLDGVPFAHQGRSAQGMDCAGLVIASLAEQGVMVDAPANYSLTGAASILLGVLDASPLLTALPIDEEPHAGDVLAFRIRREVQHMGVALGDGRMMHSTARTGVVSVTLSPLWRYRLAARYGWING